MRVLCHVQHLNGVGHFVRMHRIATGLAEAHDVHLVDGGFTVPRPSARVDLNRLVLPRLLRSPSGELVAEGGGSVGSVLTARAATLADAVRSLRPDVVIVDHYPFSKWELEDEVLAAIGAARQVNPRVTVLCSLRDLAPSTREPGIDERAYSERVLELLDQWFDHVLVHTDRTFNRLDDQFGRAREISVPIHVTGFVSGPARTARRDSTPPAVLCGGGLEATSFLVAAIGAFRRVAESGTLGPTRLAVFPEPRIGAADRAELERAAADGPVDVHEFSPDFDSWLYGAVLAIGRAGYNTVTDLMSASVPAVVVPDPHVPDQRLRADLLARHGVGTVVDGTDEFDVGVLASAIETALAAPAPQYAFKLDGVAATRRIVTELPAD